MSRSMSKSGDIPGVVILLAGFHTKGTCHVCFTTACCTGNKKIPVFRYIFAGGKSVYQLLVQPASGSIVDIHYTCFRLVWFTLESKQRPKLAQEIGNILGTAPHYERVPSCAYDIAGYRHTYCSNMTKSGMNPKTLHYSTSWDIQIYRSQWMCTRISDLMMQRRNWKGWKSSGRYRRRLSRRKRKRCRRRCLR